MVPQSTQSNVPPQAYSNVCFHGYYKFQQSEKKDNHHSLEVFGKTNKQQHQQ